MVVLVQWLVGLVFQWRVVGLVVVGFQYEFGYYMVRDREEEREER